MPADCSYIPTASAMKIQLLPTNKSASLNLKHQLTKAGDGVLTHSVSLSQDDNETVITFLTEPINLDSRFLQYLEVDWWLFSSRTKCLN